jgi:S1-C subfamily serine protease/photosystem II stability/assembly factor-like uncharacterized protein/uncharacterized FlaG/YvyC family protein
MSSRNISLGFSCFIFAACLLTGLPLELLAEPPAAATSQEQEQKPMPPAPEAPKRPEVRRRPVAGEEKEKSKDNTANPAPAGAKEDATQQRLNAIEQQLSEISKMIQGLKQPDNRPAAQLKTPVAASGAKPKDADLPTEIPSAFLKGVTWRSIGPANMGGRITDLAVQESDPSTWYAATASGGLIKTTNNGTTLQSLFDREKTVALGAVAVSASDPNIVWVGTGENNPRNSVSYGDGVYKSTDGGKTWKNMGLKETFQIGEIIVHPKDPNVVYVGALGRLYGPNDQRGVFKTVDGGQMWTKAFYIDDRTGIIEMQMHPTDPNTLIVAAWERLRDGFDSWPGSEVPIPDGYDGYDPIRKWGPGSGLYKTTDAGTTWRRLTEGLPSSPMGRIGLDWYRKDPNILYAVIDCENIGKGPAPLSVYLGATGVDRDGKAKILQVAKDSPAAKAGLQVGDILESSGEESITSFDQILDLMRKRKAGDSLTLNVARGSEKKELTAILTARSGGGASASTVWIGASGEDEVEGLRLTQVMAQAPSGKAGLQVDDIIIQVEDAKAQSFEKLVDLVRSKQAGDKIKLKVKRGEESLDLVVTLEDRPGTRTTAPTATNVYMGIQGQDAEGGGARLSAVTAKGPAEKVGMMVGDIVQTVNGEKVANYAKVVEILRAAKVGDSLKIVVQRATETKEFEIKLEARPLPSRPYSASLGGQAANVQDQQGAMGHEYGGVYRSTDGGQSWIRVNSVHSRPMYFSVIRVDPSNDQRVFLLGVAQYQSSDGGQTFEANLGRGVHADGHALWVDPHNGKHMIIGVDGGVYVTYDRGANWEHLNKLALGQFYHVAISPKYPYYVYGGLQDNGTWGGPSQTLNGTGPVNEDWLSVGGGDGFMCRVDPHDPELIYYTSQNGSMGRRNLKTGERASIRPPRVEGQPEIRFNWNTPFILSHANSRIFYAAGNYVFRSLDRGNNLQPISPEITLTKRGSATALSESPRNPNVLYVGTDDGALWVTRDGGSNWMEISKQLNLPAPRWVSTIEASRFADGRVYVCLDGHRSNDDEPYVYVSEDFGKTWKSIRNNLAWGTTRCLREDPVNENLLLVGTEFSVMASTDRGGHWNSLNTNLPTVPVFDFAFHPASSEVVAATHGRSLWIADLTALRQLKASHLASAPALYKPSATVRWRREPSRGSTNQRFAGSNPNAGAVIHYSLPKKAQKVSIKIHKATGELVRELPGATAVGLHRAVWDLIEQPPAAGNRGGRGGTGGGGTGSGAGGQAGQVRQATTGESNPSGESGERSEAPRLDPSRPRSRSALSGNYKVVLSVDGQETTSELRLVTDPNLQAVTDLLEATGQASGFMFESDEEDEEEEEEGKPIDSDIRDPKVPVIDQ